MSLSLAETAYFKILNEFLTSIHVPVSKEDFEKQEGIIELSTETLVLRITPHVLAEHETEPSSIILDVDLMLLDLDNREVNHDRFLILHQLNAVSRFTTGIIAFITEEGMLSVSKIIPLSDLNRESFSQEVAQILHAAESLYDGWNNLADLVKENQDHQDENLGEGEGLKG